MNYKTPTKCLFCNKKLPEKRYKYCSVVCIKRSWYLRKYPNKKTYFSGNPDFWKTSTGIGFKWEKWAAKFLEAKHLEFTKGVDLEWNGKSVDVKVSNIYRRKFKRGLLIKGKQFGNWVFNRNKEKPVDFFFCIALLNGKPVKKLLIPEDKFPKKGMVIGKKSKYDIYEVESL